MNANSYAAAETQRLAARLGITVAMMVNHENAVFIPLEDPNCVKFNVPNIDRANEFLERFGVLLPEAFSISRQGFFTHTDPPASTSLRALQYYCGFELVKLNLTTAVQLQPNGAVAQVVLNASS